MSGQRITDPPANGRAGQITRIGRLGRVPGTDGWEGGPAHTSGASSASGGTVSTAPLRIAVLTEDLAGSPDEGIKKFAITIARALRGQHHVALLGTRGTTSLSDARVIPTGRTFLGNRLATELRHLRPDVIFYVATASTSFWSFVRAAVLRWLAPSARVVLIGLQDRQHTAWQRHLIRRLAPDLVCVQSPASQRYFAALGCRVARVPSGVDLSTFRPVAPEQARALRDRYGLRQDRPVVLHVGHLQRHRGVGTLGQLAARWPGQVVLVASSSTRQEANLAAELQADGVHVVSEYQPQVEHFYQLADAYLFPVQSSMNSISVPLSVLEALACDLPVATTRFGGLMDLFGQESHPGLIFADDTNDLLASVQRLAAAERHPTRSLVAPFAWDAIATQLLDTALRWPRASRSLEAARAAPLVPDHAVAETPSITAN
jgi:glycosyltransferase involved in cell wall biosynthesis